MSLDKIRLGECCVSISDGDHLPPPKSEKGIPFITISNINSYNQIDFANTMFVPEDYYNKLDTKRKAQQGDILYSVVGSFGIPILIKDNTKFVFQRHIAILRPDKNVDSRFLYYKMLSREFYALADVAAIGAAQRTISLSALRNMEITLPDIDTQKRIADILSNYDNLIENNQKQIKLLEEAAQRLYKEWFVDLHFPGYESATITDGVPEGWFFTEFSDVFEYIRGKSYTSSELSDDEGTLMVNLKNIQSFGGYKRNAEKHFMGTYKREQTLDSGDVVMGITDMTQERRLVGHVALIPTLHCESTFSMDLIKLIPKIITRNYLYCAFRFGGYSSKISPLANGVNVLHLKPELMMNLKMLIPEKTIINAFDSKFEGIRLKIDALQKQIELSTEARDRLLPKLMSREIEV